MREKFKTLMIKLKFYWKKPPKGYELNYKEFLNFNIGSSSSGLVGILITNSTIAATVPFFAKYFSVSMGAALILGWIGTLIGLIRAPILSMIIDNSHSSKGKFLPLLKWPLIIAVICYVAVPFIPQAWGNKTVFEFALPDVPILGMTQDVIQIKLHLFIAFILIQIASSIIQIYQQALIGVEQTITSVSQERTNIASIKGLICNVPGSIVQTIIPFIATILYGKKIDSSGLQPLDHVELYRFFFPFCGILAIITIMFMVKGCKERVVVDKDFESKVKFFEGVKSISQNKYFWVITLFSVCVTVRAVAGMGMTYWVTTYGIGGEKGSLAYSICTIVLNNAFIPAMALSPFIIKKFGKRKLFIYSEVLFIGVMVAQVAFSSTPILVLICIFVQNFCCGLQLTLSVMSSEALDYQQWKTGTRLEGFWQNYTNIILAIFGLITAVLTPLFTSLGGLPLGVQPNDYFAEHPSVVFSVVRSLSLLGGIGAVAGAIPLLFYDLSEEKHADIVRVLRLRATIKNYANNILSDEDVVSFYTIINKAKESGDEFVINELNTYDKIVLDDIISKYDVSDANIKAREEEEKKLEFERNCELEEIKMRKALEKAKKYAEKHGTPFGEDEEKEFITNFIENSTYLKDSSHEMEVEEKEIS